MNTMKKNKIKTKRREQQTPTTPSSADDNAPWFMSHGCSTVALTADTVPYPCHAVFPLQRALLLRRARSRRRPRSPTRRRIHPTRHRTRGRRRLSPRRTLPPPSKSKASPRCNAFHSPGHNCRGRRRRLFGVLPRDEPGWWVDPFVCIENNLAVTLDQYHDSVAGGGPGRERCSGVFLRR